MGFAADIRKKIDDFESMEASVWGLMKKRHMDYVELLKLLPKDFDTLMRMHDHGQKHPDVVFGFLRLLIGKKRFALAVRHVCAYGRWEFLIVAVCTNDASLNKSVGYGTAFFTAVPDDWHLKIKDSLACRVAKKARGSR